MQPVYAFLRHNTWVVIIVTALIGVALGFLADWQAAALAAAISSAMLMWRSELDHPRAEEPEEAA
jgi:ABC-type siderophore export system fused ATPase/permease subunit